MAQRKTFGPGEETRSLRTLSEVAARAGMLTVACSRCERPGPYRLDTLIARHGADAGACHRPRADR